MRNLCGLFAAISAAALTLVGAPGVVLAAETTAPAQPDAPLPASLVMLEQKMAQIRFNTERISERTVLGEVTPPAGTAELGSDVNKSKSFVTAVTGAIQFSPRAAVFTSKVEGLEVPSGQSLGNGGEIEIRTIGNTHYTYEPSVAGSDGGRPWVRSRVKPTPKPHGKLGLLADTVAALAPTLTDAPAGPEGPFAKLIDDFDAAESVREVGPQVVDGQQTTEFTAILSWSRLLAGKLTHEEQQEISRHPNRATIEIDTFFAASGLPVRTTGVLVERHGGIGIEADILGLEVPVSVQPPPAGQTISQARLLKLEKKRARRLARKRRSKRSARRTG